ncbi:putative zinc-binding dehydrogenase [Escherichia coli]|uniref:Putative zinc-binding dehydrogenase n=1 Tax=Escherichia coli TaxID=562 RepID=A0A376KNT7_ECOLX|nr:putative zinc-binding dehydrogenase [Escherichia coli]
MVRLSVAALARPYEGILRGEVSGSDNVLVVGLGRGRHDGDDAGERSRCKTDHRR